MRCFLKYFIFATAWRRFCNFIIFICKYLAFNSRFTRIFNKIDNARRTKSFVEPPLKKNFTNFSIKFNETHSQMSEAKAYFGKLDFAKNCFSFTFRKTDKNSKFFHNFHKTMNGFVLKSADQTFKNNLKTKKKLKTGAFTTRDILSKKSLDGH